MISLLKKLHLYHWLQGNYRNALQGLQQRQLRRQYSRYKGSSFTCNSCGAQYEKFAPRYPGTADATAIEKHQVIAGYGEHEYCPNCMSTSRERLTIAFLPQLVNLNGKHILHLSPEPHVYRFLKQQATVTTADLMPGYYKTIDPNIQFADATQLPFGNNSFDAVIGNHIMEHIPNDRQAMREIYRVLKPGGLAVLQAPFSETIAATLEEPTIDDPQRQSALFGQKDHVRIYALNDYLQRLQQAGFHVRYHRYEAALQPFLNYAIQPQEGFIELKK